MTNETGYYVKILLIPAAAVLYTSYLIYVRLNKTKREAIFRKHKPATPRYDYYRMRYSPQYLPVVIIVTLSFISNAVRDMLSNTRYPFLRSTLLYLTLILLGSSVALYLRFRIFHSKNKEK